MLRKIHHVGIAVEDLDRALALYRDVLGLAFLSRETLETSGLELALLEIGESHVELLASRRPGTPIEKFLLRRGEGIHHIAYEVDDIRTALAICGARGLRVVDPEPRVGAGGTLTAFLQPKSALGVLVELVEVPKGAATTS